MEGSEPKGPSVASLFAEITDPTASGHLTVDQKIAVMHALIIEAASVRLSDAMNAMTAALNRQS